jgi:hypothetical protein
VDALKEKKFFMRKKKNNLCLLIFLLYQIFQNGITNLDAKICAIRKVIQLRPQNLYAQSSIGADLSTGLKQSQLIVLAKEKSKIHSMQILQRL